MGNSPELCNLDSSLNKDLHEIVNRHIQFTSKLDKGDPCKFSISAPKVGTSSYIRIFDPSTGVAPVSERIVQDTKGILESIKSIIHAKGTIMPDYNNRTGIRRESNGKKSTNLGGARKRKLAEDDYG